MALLIFTQTFGGAIFLAVANQIFSARLEASLASSISDADAEAITEAGGRGFSDIVSPEQLHQVQLAYSSAVGNVFYLLTGLACVGFLLSWGIGWKDIRKVENRDRDQGRTDA